MQIFASKIGILSCIKTMRTPIYDEFNFVVNLLIISPTVNDNSVIFLIISSII